MALAICEVLQIHGRIEQDELAEIFARRYHLDPDRGYGATAHKILRAIDQGDHWREASSQAFDGQGSMGNGGAMRVAPVGAKRARNVNDCARCHLLGALANALDRSLSCRLYFRRYISRPLIQDWNCLPSFRTDRFQDGRNG